jgi:hypothetical protein
VSNNLPSITSQIPRDLRMFVDRLREMVNGKGAGRLVSAKDLSDAGLATVDSAGNILATTTYVASPPAPTNVTATAAVNTVIVEWDAVTYTGYAHAEVWGSSTNDIGDAELLGQTPGFIYTDPLGPGATRYYWVRLVNTNNEIGPYNAVSGVSATTAQDLAYTMDVLAAAYGDTSEAPFFQLNSPQVIGGVTIPAGTYMKAGFIYDGVITNAKIANAAVDNAKISDLAVTTAKISDASISQAKIGSLAVTSAKIADLAVTNAKIDSLAVTEAKIASLAVTTAKIDSLAVTEAKIASLAVSEGKIANLAVTNAKINDINANKITAGYINAARIQAGTINADMIVSASATSFQQSNNYVADDVWSSFSFYMHHDGYVSVIGVGQWNQSGSDGSYSYYISITDDATTTPTAYSGGTGSWYSSAAPNIPGLMYSRYCYQGYNKAWLKFHISTATSSHYGSVAIFRSYR